MSRVTRHQILGTLLPGFEGTTLPEWVRSLLQEGLAGVCLFGENIVAAAQLRALTDEIHAANPDALIAIDEEGGDVTRLFYDRGSPYPGNAVLGRLDDTAATRAVGAEVGRALRAAGIDLDFAPDADINSDPRNPVIGVRSFGTDPQLVARHTAAWVHGLQGEGIAASVKHFPGHGDTAQDSHVSLPTVDLGFPELRRRELMPFAAAIEAGTLTVMTSHILLPRIDPENPATFSAVLLEGALRGELGFAGVIVSDALDMVGASGSIGIPLAAVRALAAGCDLLCIGTKNTAVQLEQIVAEIRVALAEAESVAATPGHPLDEAGLREPRLRAANERVRSLAAELRTRRDDGAAATDGSDGEAPESAVGAVPGPAQVQAAFALAPDVTARLAAGSGWMVLRVDAEANVAIGQVPWGPFAALAEHDPALPVLAVSTHDWPGSLPRIPETACVLLVGRDNGRRREVVALIDALRRRQPEVVTVDLGWPADPGAPHGCAEIATFGASALVGEALATLLLEAGVRA